MGLARFQGWAVAGLIGALVFAVSAHAGPGDPPSGSTVALGRGEVTGFGGFAPAGIGEPGLPHANSALALASPGLDRIGVVSAKSRSITSTKSGGPGVPVLSAGRAQILLRSLTVPGWGQATLGRNGAARVFLLVEAGVWATFAAFQIQEQMRRDTYELSARLHAGIDLSGRDEEYRRIVGGFLSSDDYNLYVVYRDAANLHYDDPAQMRAYIAEHELKGSDVWHWGSVDDLLRYRDQRKDSQRAQQRANTAMAVAIVNRFVSALHAARLAGRPTVEPRSWIFEAFPAEGGEALALRCGVRARF